MEAKVTLAQLLTGKATTDKAIANFCNKKAKGLDFISLGVVAIACS